MILSCDKISNLAPGLSTKWVCNPDAKAVEGFLSPQPHLPASHLSLLSVLALSPEQALYLSSVFFLFFF